MVVVKKIKDAVVKIDSELLNKIEEFINKKKKIRKYINKKQFVNIAVSEFLKKEVKNG